MSQQYLYNIRGLLTKLTIARILGALNQTSKRSLISGQFVVRVVSLLELS